MTRRPSGRPPIRRVASGPPKRSILIFTEGARTEPTYLTPWFRLLRQRVSVTLSPAHGTPMTLVRSAIEEKRHDAREARRGRGRTHDSVWCVFDRDEHPSVREALEMAAGAGIAVAFSNPCIELWFMLHCVDQHAYIDRHRAKAEAQRLLRCGGAVTNEAWQMLFEHHDEATSRAQALAERHIGDGSWEHENPSSTVWSLIEDLRDER